MNLDRQKRTKKKSLKDHACYVLITCDEPSEDGNMLVKMTYQGDVTLASYLLQGAQSIINEEEQNELLN